MKLQEIYSCSKPVKSLHAQDPEMGELRGVVLLIRSFCDLRAT